MAIKHCLEKLLIAAAVALFCFTGGAAFAGMLKVGDEEKSIDIYGQVNRSLLYTDDGNSSEIYNVDNDFSSTRIGLKAQYSPEDYLTIGANMEFEYQFNPSNKVTQDDISYGSDGFSARILDAYLNGNFGTIILGHGKTASDGSSEQDLSGTKVISQSKLHVMAGKVQFYDNTADALSGTPVDEFFNNMDGYGFRDRIRYDTPSFKGFHLAGSLTTEDDDADGDDGTVADGALWYKSSIGGTKIIGALAYVSFGGKAEYDNQINGSVSALFNNGFNVTFAGGTQVKSESGADDPSFYWGKIGYIAKIWSIGSTAFCFDYGIFKDRTENGDNGDSFGLAGVQNLNEWNTEIYLGIRQYKAERVDQNYDDINACMAGLRVKF